MGGVTDFVSDLFSDLTQGWSWYELIPGYSLGMLIWDELVPEMPEVPDDANVADKEITLVREGIPVPLAYGHVRMGSNTVRVGESWGSGDHQPFIFSHCLGPIESFEDCFLNDVAWADIGENKKFKWQYTGTKSQTVDGNEPTFSDKECAYRGQAYTVFRIRKKEYNIGINPNFEVEILAKQCCYLAEDYSLYTETDPNTRLEVTDSEVVFTGIQRDESAYVYYDRGINFFSGDFDHYQEVYVDSASANTGRAVVWGIANSINDFENIDAASGDFIGVYAEATSTNFSLVAVECNNGSLTTQTKTGLTLDADYYLHIERDEAVGTYGTLYVRIYTDVDRLSLVDTITLTLTEKQDFRYVYAFSSWSSGTSVSITGRCGCIDLNLDATSDTYRIYSANPATVMWDFSIDIEGYDYTTELNRHWFKELKKYSDEIPTGGTVKRFHFNFFWRELVDIPDAKKTIWDSFRGRTIRSQGKIKPVWQRSKSAAMDLDVDNIVEESITWGYLEIPNKVRLFYRDPDNGFKKAQIELVNQQDLATYGEVLREINAYYICDHEIAKRRLQYEFDRARYTVLKASLSVLSSATALEVFDRVRVTHELPGYVNKSFIVKKISPDEFGRSKLELEEYLGTLYHDRLADVQANEAIDLPNPWDEMQHPTNISLTEVADTGASAYDPHLNLTFDYAEHPYWSHAEIWTSTDDVTYTYYGSDPDGTGYKIYGVGQQFSIGDTVYVKLVAVSKNGIKEDFPSSADDSVTITAPQQIGNFYFTQYDMYAGHANIDNSATVIVLGDVDSTPKIALGPSANAISVTGSAAGAILTGEGKMYVGDGSDQYVKFDGTNAYMKLGTILIDGANTRIRSTNYVSGAAGAGFTLEPNLLEVGNIACRGIFRTAVFQKDVISAVGGTVMVSHDADVLDADMTSGGTSLTIEGNVTFAVGDILRIKDDTNDEWLEVTNISGAPTYVVTRDKAGVYGGVFEFKDDAYFDFYSDPYFEWKSETSGAAPAWKKGATVVNYGQSGDGGIYMSASESNAPYLSVFTHAGSPWSAITTRLRIGNLNGFLGYSSDLYGIAIGETDKYLKYDPSGGLQIKGTITVTSGIGIGNFSDAGPLVDATDLDDIPDGSSYGKVDITYITGGKVITAGSTGNLTVLDGSGEQIYIKSSTFGNDGIQLQYNSGNPRLYCGDGSNNYIKFDGTNVSLSTSVADALVIKSGADIKLESATGGATGRIKFVGNSRTAHMGMDYDNDTFCIYSDTHGVGYFGIGVSPDASDVNFKDFHVACYSSTIARILMTAHYDTSDRAAFEMKSNSSSMSYVQWWVFDSTYGDTELTLVNGDVYVDTDADQSFRPKYDSNTLLGTSAYCWKNVYADAGVTSCSGRKFKTNIKQATLGLEFIDNLVPIEFEWNSAEGKTQPGKFHGVIAEDVDAVLADLGYDNFAGIVRDTVNGEPWFGFRYDQLIAPLIKAVQELSTRVKTLEGG